MRKIQCSGYPGPKQYVSEASDAIHLDHFGGESAL